MFLERNDFFMMILLYIRLLKLPYVSDVLYLLNTNTQIKQVLQNRQKN